MVKLEIYGTKQLSDLVVRLKLVPVPNSNGSIALQAVNAEGVRVPCGDIMTFQLDSDGNMRYKLIGSCDVPGIALAGGGFIQKA